MEKARRITEEQKAVLDKVRHVHVLFQGLETVCSAVKDVSRRNSPGIHDFLTMIVDPSIYQGCFYCGPFIVQSKETVTTPRYVVNVVDSSARKKRNVVMQRGLW